MQPSRMPAPEKSSKGAEATGQYVKNEAMDSGFSIWDESDDQALTTKEPLDTTRAALNQRKAVARRAFLRGGRSITHFSRRTHRLVKDYGGAISIRSSQLTNLDNATAYGMADATYKQDTQDVNGSTTLQATDLSQGLQSQHLSGWM